MTKPTDSGVIRTTSLTWVPPPTVMPTGPGFSNNVTKPCDWRIWTVSPGFIDDPKELLFTPTKADVPVVRGDHHHGLVTVQSDDDNRLVPPEVYHGVTVKLVWVIVQL